MHDTDQPGTPADIEAGVGSTIEPSTSNDTPETGLVEAMPQAMTGEAVSAEAMTAEAMTPGEAVDDEGDVPPPTDPTNRTRRPVMRFLVAFAFGLLAVLTISAGALAAFESSNDGRILPGVHAGSVDLSGLTPAVAAARLREAYASLSDGTLVLSAAGTERSVSYADLGRRIDVDAMVAAAMNIGRDGPVIDRIAANVRMFARGMDVAPIVIVEAASLQHEIAGLAATVAVAPTDAAVAPDDTGFTVTPGTDGRLADVAAAFKSADALLTDPTAPSVIRVEVPTGVVEPDVTTAEASAAHDAALRIAVDTTLIDGTEEWTITAAQFRGWITFERTPDGGYGPVVAREGLEAGLTAIAAKVAIAPVDAKFLFDGGKQVVGVTAAVNGRTLNVPATVQSLAELVHDRVDGFSISRVPLTVTIVEPSLTTADATKTAPLMKPISEWTTKFPIGIGNGNGVNIWIPARAIDGTVVLPGEWFDFWKAIGPVTREAGYKDGGAIIDGHSEPQGALAGGICSCSTTLFNAALRAGLEMGARRNHYYYIARYPLGLDATVFQSSSGSVQTMSFRNDTANPILIRGSGWSSGGNGYVKFVLWSVPTGRTVAFSKPLVKNVVKATDTVVKTTDLKPGVKERVEYPTDGKDVWVTRTVTDATGAVVHMETYYSHYSRITGVLRVGISSTPTPTPTPTPSPPTPT